MTTKIEWTHVKAPDGTLHEGRTFNYWSGCDEVSGGCAFCYAKLAPPSMRRNAVWGADAPRMKCSEAYARQPYVWNDRAAGLGVRTRVFAHSMSDIFEARDDLDPWRVEAFVIMEHNAALDWLLLTKRADEILRRVPERWRVGFPRQVWQGVTVEGPATVHRLEHLAQVPAAVRFVSYEPAVGDITDGIKPYLRAGLIDWVIAGGESGPRARPANPVWFRRLRDACGDAGVPFFFKQWGEHVSLAQVAKEHRAGVVDHGVMVPTTGAEWANEWPIYRVGKKASGKLLDGKVYDEQPVPRRLA